MVLSSQQFTLHDDDSLPSPTIVVYGTHYPVRENPSSSSCRTRSARVVPRGRPIIANKKLLGSGAAASGDVSQRHFSHRCEKPRRRHRYTLIGWVPSHSQQAASAILHRQEVVVVRPSNHLRFPGLKRLALDCETPELILSHWGPQS